MSVKFEISKATEDDAEYCGCSSCGCVLEVGELIAVRAEFDSFDGFDSNVWVDTFCYNCIENIYNKMAKLQTKD